MPMTNAERQRRFRKRRARREKVATDKIDHRDAEIMRLKHEIERLRRGERWCSGFRAWPTPLAHVRRTRDRTPYLWRICSI
jgi:hypothetical protein